MIEPSNCLNGPEITFAESSSSIVGSENLEAIGDAGDTIVLSRGRYFEY